MLILRCGLYVSIGLAVLATWQSSSVGYPIEVAMLRGLLAFMAGCLVSYIAELVVMPAPPARARRVSEPARAGHEGDEDDEYNEPTSLPAVRAERDAALDESRAA
jgi:hypothetical protein